MSRRLVYDLPTRVFHWFFATLFLTAFFIAKTVDDESATFSYHMLAGMTLSFLVILRIVWGFLGTKHAKFSSFALKPADLFGYFTGILAGSKRRWAGHNPASSWAALVMMGLTLALGTTGYLMATGPENHDIKEIHEIFATLFIIVAVTHVLGIILHTIRHKELIGLSMLDGKKDDASPGDTIDQARPFVAAIAALLVLGFGFNLLRKFDPSTRSLNLFGIHLQLGEREEEDHDTNNHKKEGEHESESGEENHRSE